MHPEESDLPFEPAPALGHRHVQTFWGRLTRPRLLVPLRREVLPTPDGDELVLDHLDGPAGAPRVVLLHGLEGSAHSCYVQGLLAQLGSRGLRAVALNFRSCARDLPDLGRNIPNRTARLYHSGETTDFDHLVRSLVAAEPGVALAAIGVSLGGNVLLKWLGENPGQLRLAAAATISVPYDLEAGARKLEARARARLHRDVPARPQEEGPAAPAAAPGGGVPFRRRQDADGPDLLRLRRRRDRAAPRLPGCEALLRHVELPELGRPDHHPDPLPLGRGRPVPPGGGPRPAGRERLRRRPPRGDAARRAHRLHRRDEPAARPLLGRGARGGVRRRPARRGPRT